MSNRFIAYVPLTAPAFPDPSSVLQTIKSLFPGLPLELALRDRSQNAAGDSFVFSVDDKIYTVMGIDQPLPKDAYERAIELERVWPEASLAVARQKAHLIVASVSETKTHGDAMEMACAVSATAAALTTLTDALAVIWSNGDVISAPEAFRKAALGIGQNQLPIDRWIGFTWLDGPPTASGQRTFAALTTGLSDFVGRELEWLPTPLPPVTIAERLIGTCHYLIAGGLVIKDNDTLGISEREHIRVRFKDRGQRVGVPVLQLSVEKLDRSA